MTNNTTGNSLNRLRYTLYTPIYDLLISKLFRTHRKASIDLLEPQSGEKVLLVGAGTGLDLDFLTRQDLNITAGDITPSMVRKLKHRANKLGIHGNFVMMDGQQLSFKDNTFDKIILHLIVAVIPDPVACLQEAERVLRPGGKIVIFDKFIAPGSRPSLLRRLANRVTSILFSDITRDIDALVRHTDLTKTVDQPAAFGGNFRIILLEKKKTGTEKLIMQNQ